MRIIALKTLRFFWEQHPDAQQALQAWYRDAKRATWNTPVDIRNVYRNASIVGNNRVVFHIRGNQYRLVVAVHYVQGIVLYFPLSFAYPSLVLLKTMAVFQGNSCAPVHF